MHNIIIDKQAFALINLSPSLMLHKFYCAVGDIQVNKELLSHST